jgi:sulfhydrogenase subunit delta
LEKIKVGFFDFSCCEGCQLNVLNCENELLDLLDKIEIVNFREAMTEASDDYDIAFVEGSITRESDIPRLEKIRSNAKILIALGSCAAIGGVNSIKNNFEISDVQTEVYGDKNDLFETAVARPIDQVVKVDFKIYGCPIHRDEFISIVKSLLAGQDPFIPDYAVCVECKMNENVCAFDKGLTCLGPVVRAGCDARCPSQGNYCVGCRGLLDSPESQAHKEVLKKYNLKISDIINKFEIYSSFYKKDYTNKEE